MNAPLDPALQQALQDALRQPDLAADPVPLAEAIAQACDRIAPSWPLDRMIAVNPYWGWRAQPVAEAAARLGVLAGTRLTMPRAWFRARWQAGLLQPGHLAAAVRRLGGTVTVHALTAALEVDSPPLPRLPLVADACDAAVPLPGARWCELVTHQISQHCAAFFDDGQARWQLDRQDGLYRSWRRQIAADRGLPWPGGHRAMRARLAALPDAPEAMIAAALDALGIPPAARADYLGALLLSVNGWAAWCAYGRWQARLDGGDDDSLVALLAMRAGWELLLHQATGCATPAWAAAWSEAGSQAAQIAEAQRLDWALQLAAEIAYQQPLAERLVAAPAAAPLPDAPDAPAVTDTASAADSTPFVQAVFCIDVRSEVLRRALEAADPGVHTRGFAGFFGLPIAYTPAGSALTRPQLPGLLAPAATVSEQPEGRSGDAASAAEAQEGATGLGQWLARRRRQALQWRQRWAELRGSAASGFSLVETCGLAYGAKLLADSLPGEQPPARWEDTGLPTAARGARPRLALAATDPAAAAAMAARILQAMGLPDRQHGFAPLVLLAGHGSQSVNNPMAAGLDCGACGGQTGEVNARVLADLLNTPAVRAALLPLGVRIPPGTHFLPALHNTTTDALQLFDTEAVPPALAAALARLQAALAAAGRRARSERAPALGLAALAGSPEALDSALRRRANDWAQVRPEWGLAGCAAFIVAPRARTRGLDLQGRAFLHDYDARQDPQGTVLELIMTAPMVVTQWINLQYHASMVDPRRYGSGNKLLHNVVGGHIGVFEGNGGDLRIGLPLQSLHDGRQWRHEPLRLSVYIEAPRAMIDTIVARHAVVRELVDHGWLHLLRIDAEAGAVEQRWQGRWLPVA